MPIGSGKLRVLIATTNGPVEVLLLTEEDPAIGRSVACIGGTTETADIAAAYHAFVVRPTGIIESRFGHSCYRLDVSGRIDAGSSWQLGVLAAHGLLAERRLAQESDTSADAVLWATGSVRPVDLTVGAVSHVPEKIANSLARLKQERAAGRRVVLALPAANADELPSDLMSELSALGIEIVALSHVQGLFDALTMKLPDSAGWLPVKANGNIPVVASAAPPLAQPPPLALAARPQRRWIVPAAAAAVLLAVAGTTAVLLMHRGEPETAATSSPRLAGGTTTAAPTRVPLVAEEVPFITAPDRARIRDQYMAATGYKALATSLVKIAFTNGQPTQEAADLAAMEMCKKVNAGTRNEADAACDLYASGNVVVTRRNRPPMPPEPWVVRNPSIERPFVAAQIPLSSTNSKDQANKSYPGSSRPKAIVIAPNGVWWSTSAQASAEDAMRRSLERCGSGSGSACMVIAVDDTFVVPIPTLAKVVGFYREGALFGVKPEAANEISRRLATATDGWTALTVGAGGQVGIAVGAESEKRAIDGALADCAKHDHNCRIAVIGPFLVEALSQDQAQDQAQPQVREPTPPPATPGQLVPDQMPFINARDKARIRDEYMTAPDHKALATSLSRVAFVSGQSTQEEADQAAMAACKKLDPKECELYAAGNIVVSKRGRPLMPPEPWLVRNPAVERPFVASQLPLGGTADPALSQKVSSGYTRASRSKAFVVAPDGYWYYRSNLSSPDEATRLTLERCGAKSSSPCMVLAVDDTFVVPIPTLAKAVGLYRPEALFGVKPEVRDEVARRLAAAPNRWNAVAVGAGGSVGVAIDAGSEQSALEGALADCTARGGRDCRITVLGPFLVEPADQTDRHAATP
jgi:adenylate cyclase